MPCQSLSRWSSQTAILSWLPPAVIMSVLPSLFSCCFANCELIISKPQLHKHLSTNLPDSSMHDTRIICGRIWHRRVIYMLAYPSGMSLSESYSWTRGGQWPPSASWRFVVCGTICAEFLSDRLYCLISPNIFCRWDGGWLFYSILVVRSIDSLYSILRLFFLPVL